MSSHSSAFAPEFSHSRLRTPLIQQAPGLTSWAFNGLLSGYLVLRALFCLSGAYGKSSMKFDLTSFTAKDSEVTKWRHRFTVRSLMF